METLEKEPSIFTIAEVELVYHNKVKASLRPRITGSSDAYKQLSQFWDNGKIELLEEFKVLMLNRTNRVLGIYELSSGGMSGTVADPRMIFIAALKANASAIILAHNHPSGSLIPSEADKKLTATIVMCGEILEIQVLDHVILGIDSYFSFADEGLL